LLALVCFTLSPMALAVSPPPDGGYPGGNTAEGDNALLSLTTGVNNVAVGAIALHNDTTGAANTAIGANTLFQSNGNDNTAVGTDALTENTTGNSNTAIGTLTLLANTNGSDNTAIGYQALRSNAIDAIDNTAVGSGALSGGPRFITTFSFCTAVGFNALLNNTASNNTAVGDQALLTNTTGTENTAIGAGTLFKNAGGNNNTATGLEALFSNTTGSNNTADGLLALENNTSGHDNVAEGFQALANNKTGSLNIAVGSNAGMSLTTGSNNIDIGANVVGNASDTNTIRIGKQGTQKATLIAGISGTAVTGSSVVVNSTGKLGIAASSARFKEQIEPMGNASEVVLALKPVTFRYKQEVDADHAPQFGLVAEEVEKIDRQLVVHDEQGRPFAVRYDAVNAMLLNEFLKEHRKIEEQQTKLGQQQSTIAELKATVAKQQDTFASKFAQQQRQIEALSAGLQNVSAAIELNKSAPTQVADNR
jgi:hypothetical protein